MFRAAIRAFALLALLGGTGCERAPSCAAACADGGSSVDEGAAVDAAVLDAAVPDATAPTRVLGSPALAGMRVFQAPIALAEQISSTFGPRWKLGAARTDFHPGIDYFGEIGTPVLAIGDGTVDAVYAVGSADLPTNGNVVVVLHSLPAPVMFHGQSLTRLYAVYQHLDAIGVTVGQSVRSGEPVGTLGQTGDANSPHLHFEVRLGAYCSFQYQSAHPTSSSGLGFDPHVHPGLFILQPNEDAIRLEQVPAVGGDACTVRYAAGRGDLDLDVIETDLGALGFVERRGMDATTLARLDDFQYGWLTLEPQPFASASVELSWLLHFPTCPSYVEVRDLDGHGLRLLVR